MKKILNLSSTKIYLVSGLSLLMILGSFWHFHHNQKNLDKTFVVHQGLDTCFNRVSQTFTALMIKDTKSSYLNKNFMKLSEECMGETLKQFSPLKLSIGINLLNQLISEVHWFHQSVLKMHAPLMLNQKKLIKFSSLSTFYSRAENLKLDLIDEIDNSARRYKIVKRNDVILLSFGLIILISSLGLLSYKEINHLNRIAEIENRSLNLMQSGKQGLGSVIDDLVDSALFLNSMPITSQIFKDYHEDLLEKFAQKPYSTSLSHEKTDSSWKDEETEISVLENNQNTLKNFRTSLKEVLISVKNLSAFSENQSDDFLNLNSIRDVELNISFELLEQILGTAIQQIGRKLSPDAKVILTNQIHADKSIINISVPKSSFLEEEISYSLSSQEINMQKLPQEVDLHFVILKELVKEAKIQWFLENKIDRKTKILNANLRFIISRTPKKKNKLVSVMKGKKKDLVQSLMN